MVPLLTLKKGYKDQRQELFSKSGSFQVFHGSIQKRDGQTTDTAGGGVNRRCDLCPLEAADGQPSVSQIHLMISLVYLQSV